MNLKGLLPALAAIFSFAVVSMCSRYINLLFPTFDLPFWLTFFMLPSALESAYFGAYYLNQRTPFLVRLVELGLWLGPLYFLSGRDLGVFGIYSALVFSTWVIARGYGSQVAFMERVADFLGDQGASTVNWEYESLGSENSTSGPMGYFWRRLYFFGALIALLAIVCRATGINVTGAEMVYLRVIGSIAVASGLALQGGAYLFRLQILWSYAKADVSPALGQAWARGLLALLLLVVLVVNVAPVDYWPMTAQRISESVRSFDLKGPILSPPQTESSEGASGQERQDLVLPEETTIGLWGFLVAVAVFIVFAGLGLLFLAILGFMVTQMLGVELERLKGLPRLAAQVYRGMQSALGRLFYGARRIKTYLQAPTQKQRLKGLGETFVEKRVRERRPRLKNVRAMFRRIAKEAGRRGLIFHPSLTAREYGKLLDHNLPDAEPAVDEFIAGYQKVRYSNFKINQSDEERLLAVGAEIVEEIENLEGDK